MRTALLRPAVFCLLVAACVNKPSTSAPSPAPDPVAVAAVVDSDDIRPLARANALRDSILAGSSWTEFEGDACNPGSLRTVNDSTAEGGTTMTNRVEALERIVIAYGFDRPIDNPAGHALLRTMIGWESATAKPKWDVPTGAPTKEVIAAGLSGEYKNPQTGKCEAYVPFDTMSFVIPEVPHFVAPTSPKVLLLVFQSDSGLDKLRDAYYAANANVPSAVLLYTRLRTFVVWNDYAVVAVNRPAEQRAVVQLPQGGGGGSYIFHRVNGEWRLLVIARTWG